MVNGTAAGTVICEQTAMSAVQTATAASCFAVMFLSAFMALILHHLRGIVNFYLAKKFTTLLGI